MEADGLSRLLLDMNDDKQYDFNLLCSKSIPEITNQRQLNHIN